MVSVISGGREDIRGRAFVTLLVFMVSVVGGLNEHWNAGLRFGGVFVVCDVSVFCL